MDDKNDKKKFSFMGVLIIFFLFIAALCMMCLLFWPFWGMGMGNYGYMHMPMSPWYVLIPIFFILMIAICIWGCGARRHWPNMCDWEKWKQWHEKQNEPPGNEPPMQKPIEILKTRLAKGEINEEEYDRLLAKITRETTDKV